MGNAESAKTRRVVVVGDSGPLPSWNDGAAKRAIVEFVGRVTDPASADHVPAAERVAVFDNDGTLWPEYPLPFQAAFAVDRVRERATAEPTLRDRSPASLHRRLFADRPVVGAKW